MRKELFELYSNVKNDNKNKSKRRRGRRVDHGEQKEIIEAIHKGWVHFFEKRPRCNWSWQFEQYKMKEEKGSSSS